MPEFPEKILYAGSPPLILVVGVFGCIATAVFGFDPLQDEQPPAFVGGAVAFLIDAKDGAAGIGLLLGIAICDCGTGCFIGVGVACIVGSGNVPKKVVTIKPDSYCCVCVPNSLLRYLDESLPVSSSRYSSVLSSANSPSSNSATSPTPHKS
jgi:hypothetical protein